LDFQESTAAAGAFAALTLQGLADVPNLRSAASRLFVPSSIPQRSLLAPHRMPRDGRMLVEGCRTPDRFV